MKDLLKASSWSILTEIIAKVISPISFLILTRILSPEDFGVVAVATTFISFVQIISDMGVSRVLIQDSTREEKYLFDLNNTCFWFNTILGTVTFILCVIFSRQIAFFFGNEESTYVVSVMSLQIIFFSLSSVQNANLKKSLNFKFLFLTRMVTIAMPVFIAIPIALYGGGYWAIVIATVLGAFLNTVILWLNSKWKPKIYINIAILKNVLGKGVWSSFDEIIVWIPIGLDAYLISNYLGPKDLGLFSTSRTLFSAAIAITLGAILPVLYSHLARIQNDDGEFRRAIFLAQRIIYSLAGIMGVGVFLLSGTIEKLFFSEQWNGISAVLGIVFLILSNGYFYSVLQEALRAKGFFKEIFLVKFFSIFIIVPLLYFASQCDIYIYSIVRCLSLYIWIVGVFYWAKMKLDIRFIDFIKNSKEMILIVFISVICGSLLDLFANEIVIDTEIIKVFILVSCLLFLAATQKGLIQKMKQLILKREEGKVK